MSIAPFIRPIKSAGGTFYTFSSAAEDFNTHNDGVRNFSFSKIALLDLPAIKRPEFSAPNEENVIQFDNIPGAFQWVTNDKRGNIQFAESFQNYVLNLETMVSSFLTYDASNLHTVSERIFFKWLKEIGALRFRQATTSESTTSPGTRFTEEYVSENYSSVIKYLGNIDMVNSLRSNADSYTEIYVNIPTKDGATPLILFKTVEDENYYSSQNFINSPINSLNEDFLYGRSYDEVSPVALDTRAFFDSHFSNYGTGATAGALYEDVIISSEGQMSLPGEYQLFKYDSSSTTYSVDWWFLFPQENSYWSQPISFTDAGNDNYLIRGIKQNDTEAVEVNFKRSRLDGIEIDFDLQSYFPITSNPAIKSFSDFNAISESSSFEFNTVLVYYDVENISTGEISTNLFGVLFLNDVEDIFGEGSKIPSFKKFKPNRITGINGNAYGYKINLKLDTSAGETILVTSVNEYAPYSLTVFMEAMNRMQQMVITMENSQREYLELKSAISNLQDLILDGSELDDIRDSISNINIQLEASQLMFENSDSIMNILTNLSQEVQNIYANFTSVQMSYNLEVLKKGNGIKIDYSIPNQITLSLENQQYNLNSTNPLVSIFNDFDLTTYAYQKIINLFEFNNYLKISNGSIPSLDRNIVIYINDSQIQWKQGQSYKIVVDRKYPIDMNSLGTFDLVVYTDALDIMNIGAIYSMEIARITSADFIDFSGSPTIEIICIDPATYTFTFDIMK